MKNHLVIRLGAAALILFLATLTGCSSSQPNLSWLRTAHGAAPFDSIPSGFDDAGTTRHQARPHGALLASGAQTSRAAL